MYVMDNVLYEYKCKGKMYTLYFFHDALVEFNPGQWDSGPTITPPRLPCVTLLVYVTHCLRVKYILPGMISLLMLTIMYIYIYIYPLLLDRL